MKTADSRKQLVPPTQMRVKAGFVVYAPDSEERCIVIVDDGELEAQEKDSPHKTIFTMHPGDLVGVASLLEREPFKYRLVASRDSLVTLINEECMESELKHLPLWLLATIRSFGSKTKDMKIAGQKSNIRNEFLSLAEYLCHKPSQVKMPLQELLLEYTFLSRLKAAEIIQAFKGLARRHFIEIKQEEGKDYCRIPDTRLLEAYVDFQAARLKGTPFLPYTLSKTQRLLVHLLAKKSGTSPREGSSWVKFLADNIPEATLSDWLILKDIGCFRNSTDESFEIDRDVLAKTYLSLLFETNIRGIL